MGVPGIEEWQGQFFRYLLPRGWRVAEDGNFGVVLVAPDNAALTIMVGNAGLPLGYPPGQYLYERLAPSFPTWPSANPARPNP